MQDRVVSTAVDLQLDGPARSSAVAAVEIWDDVTVKIYTGARFYPLSSARARAEAVVTDSGRLTYVGSLAGAREFAPGSEEIDCGGGYVIPGFIDSHMHAMSTAAALTQIDLTGTTSLEEACRMIARYAADLPEGVWVTGGRWDANRWGHEPDRALLDRLVPARPVALWSTDLHTLWLNGAALVAVGIDETTPDPRGGRIVRDERGRATGVLKEDAATIAERQIPLDPLDVRVDAMKKAQQQWLSEGLVGVHDFDGRASREAWLELDRRGEMAMKVVKYVRLEEWAWAKEHGWTTGATLGSMLRAGGLKLFSDGALGSHTCHMTTPFAADSSHYGLPIASREVLRAQVIDAVSHGVSVAIHAIGDQANRDVLAAITEGEAQVAGEGLAHRHRIEHVQFIQDADVAQLVSGGIVAAMQPRHCISDLPLLDHLGLDDGRRSYAWKQILLSGGHLAFGSDAPVEPTNPLAAIYAAMTRADIGGDPATSFEPNERLSAYEAIVAHTLGSAYAASQEHDTGTLEAGKNADFIVLDTDPFEHEGGSGWTGRYDSEQALFDHALAVRDGRVQMTVVGGEVAFSR